MNPNPFLQHPMTFSQWQQFSQQITSSKQAIEQLSKLYIIIHERVKSTIKNTVINPHIIFSKQIQSHIEFIQSVLQRIRNVQNDNYLIDIQQKVLRRYQQSLLGLLGQIGVMLNIEESKLDRLQNSDRLIAYGQQKRVKYDLKSEVEQSSRRIVRAKSGLPQTNNRLRNTIYGNNNGHNQNHHHQHNQDGKKRVTQNDIGSFFPTMIELSSNKKPQSGQSQHQRQRQTITKMNSKEIQQAYQTKRQQVIQSMRKSMSPSKSGRGLSFKNKYQNNYLEMYFNQRKQFAELIFNQEAYDKIVAQGHKFDNDEIQQSKKMDSNIKLLKGMKYEDINQKLFPQFQIKTKFLKQNVKSTIANLITDIKKQLMKQYFVDNVETIKAMNEKERMRPAEVKKDSSNSNLMMKNNHRSKSFQSLQQQNKQFRETQQFIATNNFQSQMPIGIKRSNSFSDGSPNINNNSNNYTSSSTLLKARKSFINTKTKPFYQTDKWNRQTQKMHSNHIMKKLIMAKLK